MTCKLFGRVCGKNNKMVWAVMRSVGGHKELQSLVLWLWFVICVTQNMHPILSTSLGGIGLLLLKLLFRIKHFVVLAKGEHDVVCWEVHDLEKINLASLFSVH